MTDTTDFLTQLFKQFPLQKLEATDRFCAELTARREDMLARIMRMAVTDPEHYGWSLLSTERIDQIISTALYLRYQLEIPEVFTKIDSKQAGKRYGTALRRFLLARRLDPDKILPLSDVTDAAVLLLAIRPLVELNE